MSYSYKSVLRKEHGEYFLILITSIYNVRCVLAYFIFPRLESNELEMQDTMKKNKNNYLLLHLFT